MQLNLRAKLVSIVLLTTLAFVTVLAASTWFGLRQARDLADVEGRLVPKLELGPRLESQFEHLRQGMQDAVAAQDPAALDDSLRLRNEFIATVSAAGPALTSAEAAQLRHAVTAYHEAAYGVSRRLLRGEAGEALVDAIAGMQVQQRSTETLIKTAARLDRKELGGGFAAVRASTSSGTRVALVIGLLTLALVLGLSLWMGRGLVDAVGNLSAGVARFATGDFEHPIAVAGDDELGKLTRETNQMADALRRTDFVRAGSADLSDELRADLAPDEVAERALRLLCARVGAVAGIVYATEGESLVAVAGHAWEPGAAGSRAFRLGEGLVGQAAREEGLTIIDHPPAGYFTVGSGLGSADPRALVLVPLRLAGRSLGVVELALLEPCRDETRELLLAARTIIVASLEIARSSAKLRELLDRSQKQAELLAAQEEELRASNRELTDQQDELKRANDELERQRHELSAQNAELEEARETLTEKASELARVSSYKSQFLANMSHELRTPLNSMLLLSHLLGENESKNLSEKQVEYARTIHGAGRDLLDLINQVLDLAKIEAGRQDIALEPVPLADFVARAERLFAASAQEKGVAFRTEVEPGLPATIVTDRQRLERILVNLLGNALKFTEQGSVVLRVGRPAGALELGRVGLERGSTLAFAVTDTGIGIAKAAQERIFAPFEQANARADRRYGGTGLGLAIARESALLLGGDLVVESQEGRGSTFTCLVPERLGEVVGGEPAAPRVSRKPVNGEHAGTVTVPDGDYLLVVEDDPTFAEHLVELIRSRRFDAVVATTGEEALRLARARRPRGLILDVNLPDIDGFTVMDRLRQDPKTRSLPVHFISGAAGAERAYSLGAVGYLTKPATAGELVAAIRLLIQRPEPGAAPVLLVEDNAAERHAVSELLESAGMSAEGVSTARAALELMTTKRFACVVLDLGLPDMDGLGLLAELRQKLPEAMPPIVVHTGRTLTREEVRHIEAYAEAVVLKGGNSGERLVDEVRLFVQHLQDDGPKPGALLAEGAPVPNISLSGVRIVLADDDMRTVYALSALLRGKGATVMVAENGREALALLDENPDTNALLVDVMMPEMDGYEALKRLRADPRFRRLPAIALTAKAMKGERERCLEAGATAYFPKPIDPALLLTALSDVLESNGHGTAQRS